MFKLAGRVIDPYDDPSFLGSLEAQQLFGYELPHPHELDALPDSSFAVKIADGGRSHRKFPIHTKAAAFFSAAYLESNADDLPDDVVKVAAARICAAQRDYRLHPSEQLQKLASGYESEDVPAFEVTLREEPMEPVVGSLEKLASTLQDHFLRNFSRMSPRDRCNFASGLAKQAGAAAITDQRVWDYVPKPVTGSQFEDGINSRELLVRGTELEGAFAKLAEATCTSADEYLKLAHELETLDRAASLRSRYEGDLPDPYVTVFGGLPLAKTASELRRIEAQIKLAPREDLSTKEQYLVDFEDRFPRWDTSYVKIASAARRLASEFEGPYREALEEYFSA